MWLATSRGAPRGARSRSRAGGARDRAEALGEFVLRRTRLEADPAGGGEGKGARGKGARDRGNRRGGREQRRVRGECTGRPAKHHCPPILSDSWPPGALASSGHHPHQTRAGGRGPAVEAPCRDAKRVKVRPAEVEGGEESVATWRAMARRNASWTRQVHCATNDLLLSHHSKHDLVTICTCLTFLAGERGGLPGEPHHGGGRRGGAPPPRGGRRPCGRAAAAAEEGG